MKKFNYNLKCEFDGLTKAQAIALQTMFEEWKRCISQGSTKYVGFLVDGDGNFRPTLSLEVSPDPLEGVTDADTVKGLARVDYEKLPKGCEPILFDFDPIAWEIEE